MSAKTSIPDPEYLDVTSAFLRNASKLLADLKQYLDKAGCPNMLQFYYKCSLQMALNLPTDFNSSGTPCGPPGPLPLASDGDSALKKKALYWIAEALKDEPDKCGARLQDGRLVSTADDQAVHWKPLLKLGMGKKRYKEMSKKGEKDEMLRVVDNLRKLHSKKSAGRTFLSLYLQYLPEDPHKLQEPTVALNEARPTTHPGFDMGVQYCLLGQMINRPGATVPRHYAEQSNPWYIVADAFLGCDGDPSHCHCGEGSVKVWVSKVHEELKTQTQSAPMSGASLPHQQLEENESYIWPIRLIVDRPKPKLGRPPAVEKKKRNRNVAGSSKSTGARSSRQKHNEEAFREDVLKPTKAVTNMPGLEHMYRRQKEGARQPNAHRKLPK